VLKVTNLCAGYGSGQVLFNVSFEISSGQVVALLGRNGMGKTTLIRSLFGQTVRHSGTVYLSGVNVSGWTTDRIARTGLAIVPEGRQCFPNLSVQEHLTVFAARRNPEAKIHWDVKKVFELFPRLGERRSNFGNQLSGGEQQMLAIGRALVTNPKLLILDEATEGLAPQIREEIWQCLGQLRDAGQTTLIVDKHIERLVTLANRQLILEKGRVAWEGSSEQLNSDRTLWGRYLGVSI